MGWDVLRMGSRIRRYLLRGVMKVRCELPLTPIQTQEGREIVLGEKKEKRKMNNEELWKKELPEGSSQTVNKPLYEKCL